MVLNCLKLADRGEWVDENLHIFAEVINGQPHSEHNLKHNHEKHCCVYRKRNKLKLYRW